MSLSSIEQTAWLTCFCRHWASTRGSLVTADELASWIARRYPERAPRRVARRTREGIAVRTGLIDQWVTELLESRTGGAEPWDYWALGAGLDARWLRLRPILERTTREYCEFDHRGLLEEKKALVAASPFAGSYARVRPMPGDLFEGLAQMEPRSRPTLIVMEGLAMYLSEREHGRLFDLIQHVAPRATVIADYYSLVAAHAATRQRSRVLGGVDVRFGWAPAAVQPFLEGHGWRLARREPLLPRILKRIPPLGWLPLPRALRDSYLLVEMQHAGGARNQ